MTQVDLRAREQVCLADDYVTAGKEAVVVHSAKACAEDSFGVQFQPLQLGSDVSVAGLFFKSLCAETCGHESFSCVSSCKVRNKSRNPHYYDVQKERAAEAAPMNVVRKRDSRQVVC